MAEEQAQVSIETIAEMARLAGLHTELEREDRLRDAYQLALVAVRKLDEAFHGSSPGTEGTMAFDAAWPESGGGVY